MDDFSKPVGDSFETPDMYSLFNENKEYLKRRGINALAQIEARKEVSIEKTNLASIKYMVSAELDRTGVSKTALKEMIQGDKRVVDAMNKLEEARCKLASSEAKVDHLQELINNNKAMMKGIEADKRNFGG